MPALAQQKNQGRARGFACEEQRTWRKEQSLGEEEQGHGTRHLQHRLENRTEQLVEGSGHGGHEAAGQEQRDDE